MRFYWFALAALCVWRITHLLQAEDGPLDFVVRFRRRAGTGFWGKLLGRLSRSLRFCFSSATTGCCSPTGR